MPGVPLRSEVEAATALAIARLQAEQRHRIVGLLGSPPDLSRMNEADWRRIEDETAMLLVLLLSRIYEQGANNLYLRLAGSSADFAAFRLQAQGWAAEHARSLARDLTITTRQQVEDEAKKFSTTDLMMAFGLGVLGPMRAEGIAVTEITRAHSLGEFAAVGKFESESGKLVEPIWVTKRDARVCPICEPFDGTGRRVWGDEFPGGPPGHVNCRCELRWVVV